MSTTEKFYSAVEIIKSLPKTGSIQPSNNTKLKFYSYYKQATEGPCELPQPYIWDVVNRAKWDAWSKLGTMSKEEAMKNYVEEFVKTLQEHSLDELDDPSVINDYAAIMGPYIEYAPKEVQENYRLMNGKSKMSLNNNLDDHPERNHSSHSLKDYENGVSGKPSGSNRIPVNGHSMNGNNESDSEEFSDTLERVNEDDADEPSQNPVKSINPHIAAKASAIKKHRGGDNSFSAKDGNPLARGPGGNRGNQPAQQPMGSDHPLSVAPNNSVAGGSGGHWQSGGDTATESSSDIAELAMAVIRLQHIMEQVLVKLDSLEAALVEKKANTSALQASKQKSFPWSIFGISPKLLVIILAWPFLAQWLMYVMRRRYRKL